jgi:tRNA U34 5-methylaminomethyl-2-thiouridine-forming methyltransferase MnmC
MSDIRIKLIETEDGSSSLYREDLNETYHSFHGAMGESRHVFIRYGLEEAYAAAKGGEVKVFEVGMGTGLNVFLTALSAKKSSKPTFIHTLEPIPIDEKLAAGLNYASSEEEASLLQHIHDSPWEVEVTLNDHCKLHKTKEGLEQVALPADSFDVIYFDAFAPSKQPDIWSLENIDKCYKLLKPGGILVTYCAQGQFKRNLKAVGFEVEALPGAMGKKEMVRAIK